MVTITDRVRFSETDLMGVVHHTNYLRWFEMGRVAYLRAAGIELNQLMADGFMVPIIEVHCQFRQSARFDDEYEVLTTLASCSRVKIVYEYEIIRKRDGVLLAKGDSTNAFTNLEGKVERLSPPYYEKLQRMLAEEGKKKV